MESRHDFKCFHSLIIVNRRLFYVSYIYNLLKLGMFRYPPGTASAIWRHAETGSLPHIFFLSSFFVVLKKKFFPQKWWSLSKATTTRDIEKNAATAAPFVAFYNLRNP